MKSILFYVSAGLLFAASAVGALAGDKAAPGKEAATGEAALPVRMVTLFSSGVGYFEHHGWVEGNDHARLDFKTDQINDILKSLVFEDMDGGAISRIVYPSKDPLDKILRSFQVDLTSNPSLGELLNQLRGAKVAVSVRGEGLEGVILGVEKKKKRFGEQRETIYSWTLNLASGGALRAVGLDDVQTIRLEDAKLQGELSEALKALAEARDQDTKPVNLYFEGTGRRRIRLGYVVETPLWKTGYRLMLPAGPKEHGRLQGWAIVENQTDHDWDDITLTLVSGRPVSFIQEMYQPIYLARPVVESQKFAAVKPQQYQAGLALEAREELAYAAPAAAGRGAELKMLRPPAPDRPLDPFSSVSASVSSARVGELFQYSSQNVTLGRHRSAMIPIVADPVGVELFSIYNDRVLREHPMNGARLKNTTGKHLAEGPVTVFHEGGYAGDASLSDLPPGQERFISYAVDLEMRVLVRDRHDVTSLVSGRIVKGVLELTRKQVAKQEYEIENKSSKDKVLLLEHPYRSGWKLIDTPDPEEVTDSAYRFKVSCAAAGKTVFTVQEEWIQMQTLELLGADFGQIEFYSKTGEIAPAVRKALAKALELKRLMLDTQRRILDKETEASEIAREQDRIRSNMGAVDSNSQYYARLLSKLNDQETTLEKIHHETREMKERFQKQREDLEHYLIELNIG